MKLPVIAGAFALALPSLAQQQVKIADAGALVLDPDLHKSKAALAGMQAAGITSEQEDLVLNYSDPRLWPAGIATDSARKANAAYFQNYAAFPLCTYQEDSTQMSVLMIPAKENIHMPEDMRPVADLYLVLPTRATRDVASTKPRPAISKGPRWKNLPEARILSPGDLYATFDMANDQEALDALNKRGMSQPEIDAVIFRCHERNWPEGIDQFDERYPRLNEFKKYKAFVGAKWADKVLLIVPVEKNKKMPKLLRPYVDIYFVYSAQAVEIKKSRK